MDGFVSEVMYVDFCGGSPLIKFVSSLLQKVNTIEHHIRSVNYSPKVLGP